MCFVIEQTSLHHALITLMPMLRNDNVISLTLEVFRAEVVRVHFNVFTSALGVFQLSVRSQVLSRVC